MTGLSVVLNVRDITTSLRAYRALGFKVDDEWKDAETGQSYYADLSYQGSEIGLAHIPSNDDGDFQKWVSTPLGAGVVAYLTVRDVDTLHAKAKGSGFLVEVPPTDRTYGRILTLNDPDGYTVSFLKEKKVAVRKAARKLTPKKAKGAATRAKPAAKKAKGKTARRR